MDLWQSLRNAKSDLELFTLLCALLPERSLQSPIISNLIRPTQDSKPYTLKLEIEQPIRKVHQGQPVLAWTVTHTFLLSTDGVLTWQASDTAPITSYQAILEKMEGLRSSFAQPQPPSQIAM